MNKKFRFYSMVKLYHLYQHFYSWLGTAGLFLLSLLGESRVLATYIFIVSVVDFLLAMAKSYVLGQGIISRKIVRFISKTFVYAMLLICFNQLDNTLMIEDMWFTRGYSAIIVFSEIWSCLANLIIIFPDVPVFGWLQKWLKSEMENKLNIDDKSILSNEKNEGTEHNGKEDLE